MNQFIYDYDESLEYERYISEDNEQELLEHILEQSNYTDLTKFTIENITYEDALNLVQSTDAYEGDVTEWLSNQPEGLSEQFINHLSTGTKPVERVAYSLAYENPLLATQLLDELLYYRFIKRI